MARQPRPLEQLSPAYARRIAKALAAGKTRQEGRGKAPGAEYTRRKEAAERKAQGLPRLPPRPVRAPPAAAPSPPPSRRAAPGVSPLTKPQRAAVRRFANEQAERAIGRFADGDELAAWRRHVMAYAESKGYPAFTEVRAMQREAMATYRREIIDGTYEMKPMSHTCDLWAQMTDYPDSRVFFYH